MTNQLINEIFNKYKNKISKSNNLIGILVISNNKKKE